MLKVICQKIIIICSIMIVLSACSSEETVESSEDFSLLSKTSAAMGVLGLSSITYSGTAWNIRNSFRQTVEASPPWRLRDTISDYSRTISLEQEASLALGDTFSQNLFFDPAIEGKYLQHITEDTLNWRQQLEFWITPWGFLRGAHINGIKASKQMRYGIEYDALTWLTPKSQKSPSGLQYSVTAFMDEQHLIARVETRVEDAFMGDMLVAAEYSDYSVNGGVMVPSTIEIQQGGGGVFGVAIDASTVNPVNLTALMTVPEVPPAPGFPTERVVLGPKEPIERIAEGVYLVNDGYVALVVEFQDHLEVFEAGQSEARGEQIIERIKTVSRKPIRFVINSHPHSDHTAGLVPFVREGASIITEASNVSFLNMALSTPRALIGEERLHPVLVAVSGVGIREDETMRMELHHVPNGHTEGMLVAFLPEQRILFQADFTLPLNGAAANPFVIELAEYVDEAGLDFDTYLAVHAAAVPQTKADLMATIGR